MSTTLLHGIGLLVTNEPERQDVDQLGAIEHAALVIEDGHVVWTGPETAAPAADRALNLSGRCVIPGFVDSHAHLVFGGDRASEFAARMAGTPYQAGGIGTTVDATRAATDEELEDNVRRLATELLQQGVTTFECKSGYGLTVVDEERALRTALMSTPETTFLGAHVIPPEYRGRPDDYIELVCGQMLSACAPHARWIDAFCDHGAFDVDQARAVLTAGASQGLGLRLHANQLGPGDAVQLAVELGAASADHCTHLSDGDVEALAASSTVATLLPGAEFSTRSPYPDARRLLDAGATVALATDCNPGTSYTTSMPFCIALAVREMLMTPAEALWSATAGGAHALHRNDIGFLATGARADLVVLDAPSYVHLAYRPGVPLVHQVWRLGERQRFGGNGAG
jgi:imidazolonepropionase